MSPLTILVYLHHGEIGRDASNGIRDEGVELLDGETRCDLDWSDGFLCLIYLTENARRALDRLEGDVASSGYMICNFKV